MDATEEPLLLQWSYNIKMLFSARMWKTFLFIFGIPLLLLGTFLMFVAKVSDGLIAIFGGFAFFTVLWTITGVIVYLFGGFKAIYTVTNKGVYFASGKGTRNTVKAVTLIGVLAGKPGMVASGMLAGSEQDIFIAWSDIAKVKISEKGRFIEIRSRRAIKPIGLYCTAETFSPMRDLIRSKAPAETPGV